MKSKVIILPCPTYDEAAVYDCMRRGIELLGGLSKLLGTSKNILVKPNLLKPASADSAVTTHPAVLTAVLKCLEDTGGYTVSFGDSPGNDTGEKVLAGIGLDTAVACHGARFVPMTKECKYDFPQGHTAKEFYFAQEVLQADCVINVCKMKTHAMMTITGAVKNPFGLVCGARKAMSHVRFPEEAAFAGMLTDIHRAVHIPLHIMDAVVAMEGNGPGSGDPVNIGLILLSEDPVAIDTVFCKLIGLSPESVMTNVMGEKAGLGTWHEEEIELVLSEPSGTHTIDWQSLIDTYGKLDFNVERSRNGLHHRALGILAKAKGRPVIDETLCVRCGICVDHCPVSGHAVNFSKGRSRAPVYDYKKCIRCYCCQEMCPRKAIRKHTGIFGISRGRTGHGSKTRM